MRKTAFITIIVLIFGVLLAACGNPDTESTSEDDGAPVVDGELPTALPDVQPTNPGGPDGSSSFPGNAAFETSNELSENERLAEAAGSAVYSGYSCVISPEGCACEQPIVERIAFNFLDDGTLLYAFSGEGYASEWQMERVAEDHWSYTIPIYNDSGTGEAGEFVGAFTVLMILNDEGFAYTSGADYVEEGFVTCPDVEYRRVE